jgi:hypothetical protein
MLLPITYYIFRAITHDRNRAHRGGGWGMRRVDVRDGSGGAESEVTMPRQYPVSRRRCREVLEGAHR